MNDNVKATSFGPLSIIPNGIEKALKEPFASADIEWRIQQSGTYKKNNVDTPWAKVLAFVQARAIQERLDEVFGVFGWQSEYEIKNYATTDSKDDKDNPINDGVVCKLSVQVPRAFLIPKENDKGMIKKSDIINSQPDIHGLITKSDGAPFTNFESFKGGISDAFKRVASAGFGIGRYLYHLDAGFANIFLDKKEGKQKGRYYSKIKGVGYHWNPPALPQWALPGGVGYPED